MTSNSNKKSPSAKWSPTLSLMILKIFSNVTKDTANDGKSLNKEGWAQVTNQVEEEMKKNHKNAPLFEVSAPVILGN
jgi:hypothetical protein